MPNERLIYADDFLDLFYVASAGQDKAFISAVEMVMKDTPTIDAVEVVRCKDCKHRGIVTECPMCYTDYSYDEDYGYDYWDVDKTVDECFCHCGEVDAEVEG